MFLKLLEFFGLWGSARTLPVFLDAPNCKTIDGIILLKALAKREKR